MNKKLVVLLAIGALGIVIILIVVLVRIGGSTPANNSSNNTNSKLNLSNITEQDKFYFQTKTENLATLYNTYRFNNYGNLDSVASQSTSELASNIKKYKSSLIANPDPLLNLSATPKAKSFLLVSVSDTVVTTQVGLNIKSKVKNSNFDSSVVAQLEFVKTNNQWLLNSLNYK